MTNPKSDDGVTGSEALDATLEALRKDHEAVLAEAEELGEKYYRRSTEYIHARTEQARLAAEAATRVYECSKKSQEAWSEYVAKRQHEAIVRMNFERGRRAAENTYVREVTSTAGKMIHEIIDERIEELGK